MKCPLHVNSLRNMLHKPGGYQKGFGYDCWEIACYEGESKYLCVIHIYLFPHYLTMNEWSLVKKKNTTLHQNKHIVFFSHKNELMPVISCLVSFNFWSLFHVISIPFCPKTCL